MSEAGLSGESKLGRHAWAGKREVAMGRAELQGFGLVWTLLVGFGFWKTSMSFSISNQTNLGEIKFKFEFTTSTQTTKVMHQHECINKVLNLDKF